MNFADIYKKIKSIDEGGVTLPNPDGSMPAGAFTAADQQAMNNRMSNGGNAAPIVARPSITPRPAPTEPAAAAPTGAIPMKLNGVVIDPNPAKLTPEMIEQLKNAPYVPKELRAAQQAALSGQAGTAAPDNGKDLGNGFTSTKATVNGVEYPAVLDTQSNTFWIKRPANIRPTMTNNFVKVVNGMIGQGVPGGETEVALKQAGLQESINENSNENFMSLYKKIKAIDEGATPEPTAPGGVIKTKNADGTISYKPKVPGERLSGTFPATGSGAKVSTDVKEKEQQPEEEKEKEQQNETCGDMMALPMSMGHEHSGQEDSVTMSVSMNGSGDGGIRDLMNILKGIENVGEPHGDHDATDVVFGGEMEPEMEEFANSMAGASKQAYFPQSAVTDIGSNDGRGDHEVRKANGGGNPYTQVSEELVSQLSSLYQEIKEAGEKKTMSRAAKGHEKYGKEGMQALVKPKKGVAEGLSEMDKSQTPSGRDGHVSHGTYGSRDKKDPDAGKKQYYGKIERPEKTTKTALDILNKSFNNKDVAEAGKEGKDLDKVRDKYNKYD